VTAIARLRCALLTSAALAVLTPLVTAAPAAALPLTGGAEYSQAAEVAPEPPSAVLSADGRTAIASPDAPAEVRAAIDAANRIVTKPYRYGGGHARWEDRGYDCSGTVSYALHGGGLLDESLPSGPFMTWGERGRGDWITVYANGGHAYAVIAGLRLDTSGPGERGPRWRAAARSSRGFVARHPSGF
jgi:hypothetical protein